MKFFIHFILLVAFITNAIPVIAGEQCRYTNDFVKADIIDSQVVKHQYWQSASSEHGDNFIKTHYLVLADGDMAVIKHEYCQVYTLEVAYLTSSEKGKYTVKSLSSLIADIFSKHSRVHSSKHEYIKGEIEYALNKHKFTAEKRFSRGFVTDKLSGNTPAQLTIRYTPHKRGNIYHSIIGFGFSYGGL